MDYFLREVVEVIELDLELTLVMAEFEIELAFELAFELVFEIALEFELVLLAAYFQQLAQLKYLKVLRLSSLHSSLLLPSLRQVSSLRQV
jgi:hypothetical protein